MCLNFLYIIQQEFFKIKTAHSYLRVTTHLIDTFSSFLLSFIYPLHSPSFFGSLPHFVRLSLFSNLHLSRLYCLIISYFDLYSKVVFKTSLCIPYNSLDLDYINLYSVRVSNTFPSIFLMCNRFHRNVVGRINMTPY